MEPNDEDLRATARQVFSAMISAMETNPESSRIVIRKRGKSRQESWSGSLPRPQGLHCRDRGVDRDLAARRNGAAHAGADEIEKTLTRIAQRQSTVSGLHDEVTALTEKRSYAERMIMRSAPLSDLRPALLSTA
jgi:hypothetical protein